MKKPILVLGSGPAGLLAAHACVMSGEPFTIISKPEPSQIGGAQFLHHAIPALTRKKPEGVITYILMGDSETYRRKVYGQENPYVDFVSFEVAPNTQPAWSLKLTYERLWAAYSRYIQVDNITPRLLRDIQDDYSLIIAGIPKPALCEHIMPGPEGEKIHVFISQTIEIWDQCIMSGVGDNQIVYEGTEERSWYRTSSIFGVGSTEWSTLGPVAPITGLKRVKKPLFSNCDCFPEVVRIGRQGRWQKGILSDDGFERSMLAISQTRKGEK